jgi:hypothetical protein
MGVSKLLRADLLSALHRFAGGLSPLAATSHVVDEVLHRSQIALERRAGHVGTHLLGRLAELQAAQEDFGQVALEVYRLLKRHHHRLPEPFLTPLDCIHLSFYQFVRHRIFFAHGFPYCRL